MAEPGLQVGGRPVGPGSRPQALSRYAQATCASFNDTQAAPALPF
jgi:hypothetical protein